MQYADFPVYYGEMAKSAVSMTMLKEMGEPVFMWIVNLSGLPLTMVMSGLWIVNGLLAYRLVDMISSKKKMAYFFFLFIVFNLVAFDKWCGVRPYRSSVSVPMYLLMCLAFPLLYAICSVADYVAFRHKRIIGRMLIAILVPVFIFESLTVVYKSVNDHYFGVYETNMRNSGEPGRFISNIYSIESERRDYFSWLIKDAVFDSKVASNWAEAEQFYKKVNDELEEAFADGRLKKDEGFRLISSLPALSSNELGWVLKSSFKLYG